MTTADEFIEYLEYLLKLSRSGRAKHPEWKKLKEMLKNTGNWKNNYKLSEKARGQKRCEYIKLQKDKDRNKREQWEEELKLQSFYQ